MIHELSRVETRENHKIVIPIFFFFFVSVRTYSHKQVIIEENHKIKWENSNLTQTPIILHHNVKTKVPRIKKLKQIYFNFQLNKNKMLKQQKAGRAMVVGMQ